MYITFSVSHLDVQLQYVQDIENALKKIKSQPDLVIHKRIDGLLKMR